MNRRANVAGRGTFGNIPALLPSMKRLRGSTVAVAVVVLMMSASAMSASACIRPSIRATADAPDPTQLWQPPNDLEQRDLFHGAGGPSLMPDRSEAFEFVAEDRSYRAA